jgi:hypothetical protein
MSLANYKDYFSTGSKLMDTQNLKVGKEHLKSMKSNHTSNVVIPSACELQEHESKVILSKE